MPNGGYVFPGAGRFVNGLSGKFNDASLIGAVNRIPAVQEAMQHINNAARTEDAESRNDLLRRAANCMRPVAAALAAVEDAIGEMVANMEGTVDPTEGRGVASMLQVPMQAAQAPRTAIEGEPPPPPSGPVWGVPPGHAGPEDPAAAEAERQRREGIDVGMSGGPLRPDSGVNQDINQATVPTQYEQPLAMHDVKQSRNPPRTEPNESDDGMGHELAQGTMEGSGLHPLAMQGGVMAAAQPGTPPEAIPDAWQAAKVATELAEERAAQGPEQQPPDEPAPREAVSPAGAEKPPRRRSK
jgi:hypothetical protein